MILKILTRTLLWMVVVVLVAGPFFVAVAFESFVGSLLATAWGLGLTWNISLAVEGHLR